MDIFIVLTYAIGVVIALWLNMTYNKRFYKEYPNLEPHGREKQLEDSFNIIFCMFSWAAVLTLLISWDAFVWDSIVGDE